MNISTQLTEKDKKLLIFLVIFLIVAGIGWFVIKPTVNSISQLGTDIAYAETSKHEDEYNISKIPANEDGLKSSVSDMQDAADSFYPLMESQEIDKMLTLKALDSGFVKSDLRELEITSPENYSQFSQYLYQPADGEDVPELTGIYSADVSFTLYGTRSKLENFIDILANEENSIRIASFLWTEDDENEGNYFLKLNLQIFMADAESSAATAQTLIENKGASAGS